MVKFRPGQFGAAEKLALEALENSHVQAAMAKYESTYKELITAARKALDQNNFNINAAVNKASVNAGNARSAIASVLKKHADLDTTVAERVSGVIQGEIRQAVLPVADPVYKKINAVISSCIGVGSSRAG